MIKAVLSGTLLLATLLIPFKASAQQEALDCSEGQIQLRSLDENTIVCREIHLTHPSIASDELRLYRSGGEFSTVGLGILSSGRKLITIIETRDSYCSELNMHCSRTTQFLLEGRRFSEWVAGHADQELLNAYSSDVTLLLDTLEVCPRETQSF